MRYSVRLSLAVWCTLIGLAPVHAEGQASLNPARAAAPLTAAEEGALQAQGHLHGVQRLPRVGGGAGRQLHDGLIAGGDRGSRHRGSAKDADAPKSRLIQLNQAIDEKYRARNRGALSQALPQRRPAASGDDRPAACGGPVRGDVRRVGRMCGGRWLQPTPIDRWGRGKQPVFRVSWHVVTGQYLPWLSHKTGKTYRLLSESEWEYVARAGSTTRFAFGDTILKRQARILRARDRGCRLVPAQCLRPPRHARQHLRVGSGLLEQHLRRCARGRLGLGHGRLQVPDHPRRLLGQRQSALAPYRTSRQGLRRLSRQCFRVPRRQGAGAAKVGGGDRVADGTATVSPPQ